MPTCLYCGVDFEREGKRGPAPSYCKPSHRRRAHEKRTWEDLNKRASESTMKPPKGDLVDAAVSLHELYLSFIEAGFTEQQALYLAAQIATGKLNGNES